MTKHTPTPCADLLKEMMETCKVKQVFGYSLDYEAAEELLQSHVEKENKAMREHVAALEKQNRELVEGLTTSYSLFEALTNLGYVHNKEINKVYAECVIQKMKLNKLLAKHTTKEGERWNTR